MTACVNKKHTRRVALAISASLVGALSLGAAAPAVAFADDGISTLEVQPAVAWKNGEVTYAYDNNGVIVDDPMNAEFLVGTGTYLVPSKVKPKDAAEVTVSVENMRWFEDVNGNGKHDAGTDNQIMNGDTYDWKACSYVIEIDAPAGSGYTGTLTIPFKVVNKSLSSATIYDASGDSVADTTFTYTGTNQKVGVLIDGVKTSVYDGIFNIEFYQRGTTTPANGAGTNADDAPINAGKYTARITGVGDYNGSVKEVDFEVGQLDLTTAVVSLPDAQKNWNADNLPGSVIVNGVSMSNLDIVVSSGTTFDPGVRTATIKPSDGNDNVTGSATASYNLVTKGVLSDETWLQFKGASYVKEYVVYLGTHASHIDEGDFAVASAPSIWGDLDLDVVYRNAAGEEVSLDTVNSTVGTYTATIRVDAEANGFKWGSDVKTVTIKTRKGTSNGIDANANLTFTWNGTAVSGSINPVYDGQDVLAEIGTTLRLNDKDETVLEKGADYTVTAYDANFEPVEQIVDAGNYTVVVSSDVYEIKNSCTLDVHVSPYTIKAFKVGSDDEKQFGTKTLIPYDGQDHGVYFSDFANGKETRLPDGVLELDHFEYTDADKKVSDVDVINGIGFYRAYVTLADGVTNYRLGTSRSEDTVTVSDAGVFADVPSTHWGAEGIYKAYDLGYMSGYAGTTFFGPEDNLSRAQAAVVLFNMGTGNTVSETDDLYNKWEERGLAFPDAEQWYAAELGWASQVGVVSGYPNGNYGGSDEITREQFAIMLRNYAAAKGEDVTVDDVDAALEGVKDADTISDWAREAVAWAVENGVMGAEGYVYADQPVQRAQVALMTTRYQPQELDKDDFLIDGARQQ